MNDRIRTAGDPEQFRDKEITLRHGSSELDQQMIDWAKKVGARALLAIEGGRSVSVWENPDAQKAA